MLHAEKTLKSGCGLGTRLMQFPSFKTVGGNYATCKYTITVVNIIVIIYSYVVLVLSLSFSICLYTCFTTFLCFVLPDSYIYWCVSDYIKCRSQAVI